MSPQSIDALRSLAHQNPHDNHALGAPLCAEYGRVDSLHQSPRGFRELGSTDGENEERLPDVQYEWGGP
jgi:hypothetical protein